MGPASWIVEVKSVERQRETYRRRLRQLDAKLQNLQLKQSPAEILREDRDRHDLEGPGYGRPAVVLR